MNMRMISVLMIAAILISVFSFPATAVEGKTSEYISRATANLSKGNGSGKLYLLYQIEPGSAGVTRLGVFAIVVREADGSFYKRISGTVANGLLKNTTEGISDDYTIQCEPSTEYYCEVTFLAQNAAGQETRTVITGVVRTPA